MEVRNCTTCGRIFNSVMDIKRCPACRKDDEEKFREIRDYLYDHSGATIEEVAEALDVDRKKILHFLREGRLETIGVNMVIQCENCGAPIRTGKYCDDCTRDMTMNLKSAAKTIPKAKKKAPGSGMHIKQKKK
jgi:flagellar operon protein (TIGR03826 family)